MPYKRHKISIIGAGNVGATCAHWLMVEQLGDIILLDLQEHTAQGKALDLYEASPVGSWDVKLTGTSSYKEVRNSDVVVITAGLARKPGMTRSDLLNKNAQIVKSICKEIKKEAPNSVVIVVSNPLDAMAYVAKQALGFPRERVIGMAGVLDTARFKSFVAEKIQVSVQDVHALVLGGHGDSMVPLTRHCSIGGIPLEELLSQSEIDSLIARTRKGGAEIVGLLKDSSAYYAPSISVMEMVRAILRDQNRILPCSAYLEGEYGARGLFLGVPCKLGGAGLVEILEIKLNEKEKKAFKLSLKSVKDLMEDLSI